MNQAELQDATDRAREDYKRGGGSALTGLAVWAFILYAAYRYFFG